MQVDATTINSAASAGTAIYHSIDLLLGAVFVLFYAGTRFNTPATNRSSTTAGRYFVGLSLYCLAGLCCYVTLVAFPNLLNFTMYGQQIGGDPAQSKISLPLFVALLLTVLLPKIPLLNSFDRWVCAQFQKMAAIPWEVVYLSAELGSVKLEFSPREQASVQQQLEADDIAREDIIFEPTETPQSEWTRVTALLQKVDGWKSDRRLGGYFHASNEEWAKLRDRHEMLVPKAKTCFYLRHEDAGAAPTRKAHQAMLRYEEDFMEHVKQLRAGLLEFIARGVLHSELTNRGLETRLNAMGFKIEWPDPPFSLNQLLLIFTVICGVMLPAFIFFGSNRLSFESMLIRLGLVGFTYVVAVACAVFPKAKWNFAQLRPNEMRPIAFYFVAGLMSAGISFLTSIVVQAIWMHRLDWALQRSRLTYPWLLISFATTFITALLVDNPRYTRVSAGVQRCLEGLTQALLMLVVTYLTCIWLSQRVELFKDVDLGYLKYSAPRPLMTMVMGAAVGFVIGFLIPTWYRCHQEEQAKERARSLTIVAPAPVASRQTAISV